MNLFLFAEVKFPDNETKTVAIVAPTKSEAKTKFKMNLWREFGCVSELYNKKLNVEQKRAQRLYDKQKDIEPQQKINGFAVI